MQSQVRDNCLPLVETAIPGVGEHDDLGSPGLRARSLSAAAAGQEGAPGQLRAGEQDDGSPDGTRSPVARAHASAFAEAVDDG